MNNRTPLLFFALGLALFPACDGGSGGGGSSSRMNVSLSSNGFGPILPYRTNELDENGVPTGNEIELTTIDAIVENVNANNPILPPTSWRTTAELPDGTPGNQFIYSTFTQALGIDSVLDGSTSAASNNHLIGSIQVLAVNPLAGTTTQLSGRAFIGGQTYGFTDEPGSFGTRKRLEQWVEGVDSNGDGNVDRINVLPVIDPVSGAVSFPGEGFPGAVLPTVVNPPPLFAGAADLVLPETFVFVPDTNNDLSAPFETFPVNVQIRMRMSRDVESKDGRTLQNEALASATVGTDTVCPEVSVSGQNQDPVIIPGNGEANVDPTTSISVSFTEPVQPFTIGDMDLSTAPQFTSAIQIQFGPPTAITTVPHHVRFFTPFDLSRLELVPFYSFPSNTQSTDGQSCGTFSQVAINVNANQFTDLDNNFNTLSPQTGFTTGEGPGLVNAPVAPDVMYVARSGARPGLSVIDLNGFGQSTGNPDYGGITDPIVQGNTNFPNNPNLALGPILSPPLSQGTCTFDGGSQGVFSLTKSGSLDDLLIGPPLIESAGDMAIGHALDNTFNNGSPFGCQAGGGNLCAQTGLKQISTFPQSNTSIAPNNPAFQQNNAFAGSENIICWSPHPNPPPLIFPPLCLAPMIGGEEPTTVDLFFPPTTGAVGGTNLLSPGPNWSGVPNLKFPPTDLLTTELNMYFLGPSAPPQPGQGVASCSFFSVRQQVGHFLYVVDQVAREVVVLNSNRMSVIDRIPLPDPSSLAMSPNLDLLAVTNRRAGIVSFIDVNPGSSRFHEVVQTTNVGRGPSGIAWDSGNEDIFVCNEAESSVSIISAFDLQVRKTLRSQLKGPFDVAITPRQASFGFLRNVYFAWILNKDGTVTMFESGPNELNGWGFDDIIANLSFQFINPKAIAVDATDLNGGVWIVHEAQLSSRDGSVIGRIGQGAVSNLAIVSGNVGPVPLNQGTFQNPSLRDLGLRIRTSIGPSELTGVPVDIGFDYQVNLGAYQNFATSFSAGLPITLNGKSLVRFNVGTNSTTSSVTPRFMFLAIPSPNHFKPGEAVRSGVVDVIDIRNGFRRIDTDAFQAGIQSLPVAGAIKIVDYFRQ